MWRSRTIFIILCNVSWLWACALTATHSLHTPNSHFQSLYGSATDANLEKCFPSGLYSKVALLLIIQLFSQLSVCPSICPSSPSLFCCSARVSLNHLTLACRRSCSHFAFPSVVALSVLTFITCASLQYCCTKSMQLSVIFSVWLFFFLPRIVKCFQSGSMSLVLERVFEWLLLGDEKAVVSVHVSRDCKAG